jgi:hypothetical protein
MAKINASIRPTLPTVGQGIGKAIGRGLEESLPEGARQAFHQSKLQDAFDDLKNNPSGNFMEDLARIAPVLATTPGGSQLLGELAPLLANRARSQVYTNEGGGEAEGRGSAGPGRGGNQRLTGQGMEQAGQVAAPGNPDKFLNPQDTASADTTFPQPTTPQDFLPEMSYAEKKQMHLDTMKRLEQAGQPDDPMAVWNYVNEEARQITDQNNRLREQQKDIKNSQDIVTSGVVTRADNLGMLKEPEDRTVISKLALENKNAPDSEKAWEAVRTGYRDFSNARSGLERMYTVPGPIDKFYRKVLGSYKDKEQASKDAQRGLDHYRKHGLYDEARKLLTNDIGLGAEDTEEWLFPPTPGQKKQLDNFPKNNKKVLRPGALLDLKPSSGKTMEQRNESEFPGEAFQLDQPQFEKFKDELGRMVSGRDNEPINLISLRGRLNQDKKYAWQDVSKAINELIDEQRFTPNIEQEKQLKVIQEAPMPGLAQMFDFMLKGTK